MKSYSHLYEQYLTEENYYLAVSNATRNKGKKKKKRERCERYRANKDKYKKRLMNYAANFKPAKHPGQEIYDGIRRKKRMIYVPTMDEQIVHHMVVNVLKPIIMKSMYRHSYGSLPKRGAIANKKKGTLGGKEAVEKFIREHPDQCTYCMKLDIHKFFDSVPHDILKAKFARKIKDKRFLEVIYRIIDSDDKEIGIPIGFYTSQWFANFYLSDMDHYIKQELHAVAYFRYMDDLVIFGPNKARLHQMRIELEEYLARELKLELNPAWQIYLFHYLDEDGHDCGRFLDFMGFRFYRNRTTLRRALMLHMTRKARRMGKKEHNNVYECRQMLAYNGWLAASNTRGMYKRHIKPYVDFPQLKRQTAAEARRRSKADVVSE